MNAHFVDLLNLPYRAGGIDPATGVDCLWVTRAFLDRFLPDFQGSELPSSAEEQEAAVAAIDAGASRWRVIGSTAAAATNIGDVIHTERPDGGAGVAVVVDQVGRVAITATIDRGVHLVPLRHVHGVVAVLRRSA